MRKKVDKVAALRRVMAEAAAWSEHRTFMEGFSVRIEDALKEALADLLSDDEIVEAAARLSVFDALEDDWIEGSGIEESRLALSKRSLRNHLLYAQGWFERHGEIYLALAKKLKRLQRRIPGVARRAPGGVHRGESLKDAIERAAAAGDAEAGVIAAWARAK
jgi:ATP/maltotriose-dependent transcriptional regulator MalT